MSNVFDDIISESEGKPRGMVDMGLGEPRGCDPMARQNTVALDERMKIESEKLSDVVMTVRGLEQVIQEMQVKLALMEQMVAGVRGSVVPMGNDEFKGPGNAQALPTEYM